MRFILVAIVLSVAAPAFADDLVGTWNVVMKTNYSTCAGSKVGDEIAQVWTLSKSGQTLVANVVGTAANKSYLGSTRKDGTVELHNFSNNGVELVAVQGGELHGRRVVSDVVGPIVFSDPPRATLTCAVIYDLVLKRQR